MSQSIGLPDRAMRRSAGEVEGDPECAAQLTSAFLLGVAANSYQGRGSNTQAITIGGADSAGRDQCNAVTGCFLDAFARTPVADPHVFLRWHSGMDRGVWDRALAMLSRGRSMPLFVNDHLAAPGLQDAGIAPEDAWDYCIAGCNEIAVPGRCTVTAWAGGAGATLIDVKIVQDCLERAADSPSSVDEILLDYEQAVEASVRKGYAARQARIQNLVARMPFPLCSALCHGCVEEGRDYLAAMPYRDIQTEARRTPSTRWLPWRTWSSPGRHTPSSRSWTGWPAKTPPSWPRCGRRRSGATTTTRWTRSPCSSMKPVLGASHASQVTAGLGLSSFAT